MIFRSLQFSIIWISSYRIRTDQIVLARINIPLKDHKTIWESRKLLSKPFSYFFLVGCPWLLPIAVNKRYLLPNQYLTINTAKQFSIAKTLCLVPNALLFLKTRALLKNDIQRYDKHRLFNTRPSIVTGEWNRPFAKGETDIGEYSSPRENLLE